jgi:hypothetical protein
MRETRTLLFYHNLSVMSSANADHGAVSIASMALTSSGVSSYSTLQNENIESCG